MAKYTFEEATSMVSKAEVEQFEAIRVTGMCNMLDIECVHRAASSAGYRSLEKMSRSSYFAMLEYYGRLRTHYGI